jgi:branched-chain amino acid transport system substrate-binding protein
MFRRFGLALLVLASILTITGCGATDDGTFKVAILAPLSGDVAAFGSANKEGCMVAINEWNENGGLLGKQIEPILEDSQCSPEAGVTVANKVIEQDSVDFIIGAICSSASIPISEIAMENDVLQISPTSSNPSVTVSKDGNTKNLIFRACFIDSFQGQAMAQFAANSLEAKSAAVLFDQGNDYSRGLAEFFRDEFEAQGGEIVVWETYTGEDTDFSAALTKVKDADPDVLWLPDYYSTVNLIAPQAQAMGIDATMLGTEGWDSSDLDLEVVQGAYYTTHYSPDDPREIVQNWVTTYKDDYGKTPDSLATLAYDATNILFQAIEEAGTDDPIAVAEVMQEMQFSVVSGDFNYDASNNPVKSVTVLKVVGDSVEFVDTVNP